MKAKKNYTISLDIGTNSVGWAVLKDDFSLVSKKMKVGGLDKRVHKNFWGVRLFEEGQVAADARGKRGTRRRLKRRRERLLYLQEIFSSEMAEQDPNFFARLNESFLWLEDKQIAPVKYPLFRTEAEEKAYYKEFPTIYHLRHHLMNNQVSDLRLIYLAMHHILKFRGHFIQEGLPMNVENINIQDNLKRLFSSLNDYFRREDFEETEFRKHVEQFDSSKLSEIEKILKEKISKSTKSQQISKDILGFKKELPIFKAIVGNKVDISGIFDKAEYAEKMNEDMPKDIYFSKENFNEKYGELEAVLEPEELIIIQQAKAVYESMILAGIMNGQPSLSLAMIEKYDNHARDLKALKTLVREHLGAEKYAEMFKKNLENNYKAYVKGFDKGPKLAYATQENFYKYLVKFLEPLKDLPEVRDIFKQIELETYLPKQRMFKNGAIPYQVHEHELVKIIEKQASQFAFLEEKAEGSNEYKIQTLMKFRIPYYVGPLTPANQGEIGQKRSDKSRFSWMQKRPDKKDEKITPWNIENVVDKDASAVEFIQRMTNFDTYLPEEKVLPQHSLLYQEFTVLQELMISGYFDHGRNPFDAKTRKLLIDKVWKKKRSVSKRDVYECLVSNNITQEPYSKEMFFGADKLQNNFNTKMTTYQDLLRVVDDEALIKQNVAFFDRIVEFQTIFEDNQILKRQIKKFNDERGQLLTPEQVSQLSKKHYTGWGRLSRRLLDGLTDDGKTIMEYLRTANDYNQNFMSLINDKSKTFAEQIEKAQLGKLKNNQLSYDLVADLAGSPAIKRGIWQSLKVVDELTEILGKENISRVVIEMARENQTSKRTKKRVDRIKDLQKNLSDAIKLDENQNFDNEKVFLYYLQNGRDMYTGESLDLSHLSSYEVDHIIPQTYTTDNSWDNKVLVSRESNQKKGGDVPSSEVVKNMRSYWKILLDAGMISRKKYANLTKADQWKDDKPSEKDLTGFINRQLVETRQITKNVAQILTAYFEENKTEILTPKAGLTSQFRKGVIYLAKEELTEKELQAYLEAGGKIVDGKFVQEKLHEGFYKVREINDYHHAHDAYLNGVVANYLYLTFPENQRKILVYGQYDKGILKQLGKYATTRKNNFRQFLTTMREENWVNLETGELIAKRNEALNTIDKVMSYKQVNVVKKTEEHKGKFSDESLYGGTNKNRDTKGVIPLKTHLSVEKYGGFDNLNSAYSIAFSYTDKKGNHKITLARVPVVFKSRIEKNTLDYLQEQFKDFSNIKIVRGKIPNNSKVVMADEKERLITSYSFTWPFKQYHATREEYQLLSRILQTSRSKDKNVIDMNIKGIEALKHEIGEDMLHKKLNLQFKSYMKFVADNQFFSSLGKFEGISVESILNGSEQEKFENQNLDEKIESLIKMFKRTWKKQEENKPGKKSLNTEKYGMDLTESTLIHQSVTGLYETREKLK